MQRFNAALASTAAIALAVGFGTVAKAAPPADWSSIPSQSIMLFYPGESTYTWLRSPEHGKGKGAKMLRKGKSCLDCHEDDEEDMGDVTVSGEMIEPNPIEGKNGSVELTVQVAYDAKNIYWRFQWPTQMDRPGRMHDYMRFDGEKWAFYGGPRSAKKVRDGEEPPLYEDRLAIMIDDGSVPRFAQEGCWLTCHDGMRDTRDVPTADQVKAQPLLGKLLKKHDVRKYLPSTRTDEEASWDKTKSADEIAKIKAAGGFLDLMQWRAARSNPVKMADDGYVLEYRLFDKGVKPFSWNVDKKTMTPKYMFDKSKVGVKSLTVDEIGDPDKPYAMILEENAVPYDPNAGWKEGDVLPGRLLSREKAKGSAADNKNVVGTWEDGVWTVVWTRPLDTGHPQDDKILKEGKVYEVGFAIHDDNVTTRYHFVSFPRSLGIGTEADIEAVKVE